jgi:hypothetical protein
MSNFSLIPFKAEHVKPWAEQPINHMLKTWIANEVPERLEKAGHSVSGVVNGEILVCGGTSEYWPGRCELWTAFNENSRYNFVPVFRGIKRWLDTVNYRRIELSIPLDPKQWAIGCRRAVLLGFELEVKCMRGYFPNGSDASLYVRLK